MTFEVVQLRTQLIDVSIVLCLLCLLLILIASSN